MGQVSANTFLAATWHPHHVQWSAVPTTASDVVPEGDWIQFCRRNDADQTAKKIKSDAPAHWLFATKQPVCQQSCLYWLNFNLVFDSNTPFFFFFNCVGSAQSKLRIVQRFELFWKNAHSRILLLFIYVFLVCTKKNGCSLTHKMHINRSR